MFDHQIFDYATVSAVVAALVSVLGNAFNIQTRYRALLAVIVGIALVAMPDWLMQKSIAALLIGLTASGVYSQVKKREYGPLLNTNASSNDSSSNPQSNNNSAPAQSSNIPPIQSSSKSPTPSSATPRTGPRIRGPQDI